MYDGDFLGLIVVIGVAIGIFLLLRELFCWYYKINKVVELLEEANVLLRAQIEMMGVSEGRRNQQGSSTVPVGTVGRDS